MHNACARSARLANHANALRRHPLDNSPADGGARPPSIPLRAPVPPTAHRARPAGAATSFAPDVTDPAEPGTAPSRFANGATADAADPGPACPAPLRLHSRTPLHFTRPTATDCSLVRLTTSPLPKPTPARRDAAGSLRARQAGCSPAVADSPGHNDSGPRSQARSVPPSCVGRL